jgi:hypothetical protein
LLLNNKTKINLKNTQLIIYKMQESLNIVELIENNPITKLNGVYQSKLIEKIKTHFNDYEQQMFVASFYCYLNYDSDADFVIDLDNVWKWIGYNQKVKAKELLEKYFTIDKDYKLLLSSSGNQTFSDKSRGGHNKETFMLTVDAFKMFCMKAGTKKADEIHKYYVKMERILQSVFQEKTTELTNQVQQKDQQLQQKDKESIKLIKESKRAIEQATIVQFPEHTECIYIGTIENTNDAQEKLIKFGHSNNLAIRILDHRKKYTNFTLEAAFKVHNKVEIENLIKAHARIKRQIRSIEVSGHLKTELIAYDDDFTIEKLKKIIADIIRAKTYSVENFDRLMNENRELQNKLQQSEETIQSKDQQLTNLTLEIEQLKECIEKQKTTLVAVEKESQSVYHNEILQDNEMTNKFNEFIATMCIVRPDVEDSAANLEGQLRIWLKTKPKKEIFHAFKEYLDIRFKHARLVAQTEGHVSYGYVGVKLIPIQYVKKHVNNDQETFLFQVCKFSPSGKILNSTLLEEYRKWKGGLGKPILDTDMKELKTYLNSCEYVIKATVWAQDGSNEGYYGVDLREQTYKPNYTGSSTGKEVEKVVKETGHVLQSWVTIAKAAVSEGMCAAKMSRSIKSGVMFNDYFYRIKI